MLAALVVLALAAPPAGATAKPVRPTIVSGESHLPAACRDVVYPPGFPPDVDAEVRPVLTVRATNSDQMIAAWKQDPNTTVAMGRSIDGGRSWSPIIPPTGACTGGTPFWHGGNDPELAAGEDGTFYLAAQVWGAPRLNPNHAASAVVVSRSTDGGATWGSPNVLQVEDAGPSFAITQDVTNDTTAYVAMSAPPTQIPGAVRVWRTGDSGATWSELPPLVLPAQLRAVYVEELFSFGDGSLMLLAADHDGVAPRQIALRSCDRGMSWEPLVVVPGAPGTTADAVKDPEDGAPVVQGNFLRSASAPDGGVLVVWPEIASVTSSRLMAVSSNDGGATWRQPYAIREAEYQMFLVAPAVADRGRSAVTYYSARPDAPHDGQFSVELRVVQSNDDGATWRDGALTPSMDLRKSMIASGMWIGYRHDVVPRGAGFAAVFPVTDVLAHVGRTDIAFLSLTGRLKSP